jgi:hypothetical protein
MASKENYFDFTGKAMEEARKAEEEAKAKAAAGTPEPPKLDNLVGLTIQAFQTLGYKKGEVIPGTRQGANLMFERAISSNARERFKARFQLHELRYTKRTPESAKGTLEMLWNNAPTKDKAPTEILKTGPAELKQSSVAMEYVSRINVMKLEKNLENDPKMWWQEVARAYKSIDFRNLTPQEAADLKLVFENSFDHMRELAAKHKGMVAEFPSENKDLWKGLGDYYFSQSVPDSVPVPDGVTQENWDKQRNELNTYLRNMQDRLQHPHTEKEEQDMLNSMNATLDRGVWQERSGKNKAKDINSTKWGHLEGEARDIQYRLAKEAGEMSSQKEGRPGGPQETAEERAELSQKLERWKPSGPRAPTAGMFYDIGPDLASFKGEAAGIRSRLVELDELFRPKNEAETFDWNDEGKLRTAYEVLNDIDRSYGKTLNTEQRAIIEKYRTRVSSEIEMQQKREQPVNRIYLTEDEYLGLDIDGINTFERVFGEAIKAIADDPESPLAKFYLDRLELMEYQLFSVGHGRKIVDDVVVVKSQKDLLNLAQGKGAKGRRLNPEQIDNLRKKTESARKEETERLGKERESFSRSIKIRLREVQFMQAWTHADGANNQDFLRFVNGRFREDDFYGMDGLYGGLVQRYRNVLRTKYEKLIFKETGLGRNAHIDRLWARAIRETELEMRDTKKHPGLEKIWNDYLDGEYFKEDLFSSEPSLLKAKINHPKAHLLGPRIAYGEASKLLSQMASFRMIMSAEKYNLDYRYLPQRYGERMGQFPTQFLEKQKVVKVINPYEGWELTWGGFTGGDNTLEKLEAHEQAKTLTIVYPEIKEWAQEVTDDLWDNYLEGDKFRKIKDNPELQREVYGKINAYCWYTVDPLDRVPEFSDAGKAADWIETHLSKKKLQEEIEFSLAMKSRYGMNNGLMPYLVVEESGARRAAHFGFLKEVLGGDEELAEQNFLTHAQLDAGSSYFSKKSITDTKEAKKHFLEKEKFIAKYRPHSVLLVLREGESIPLRSWIEANIPEGQKGFGKYYEDLSLTYDELFSRLALKRQIDYSSGLTSEQKPVVRKYFAERFGAGGNVAKEKEAEYFKEMKKITDYLLNPTDKSHFGYGAIEELTNIRYGHLLMKARWDDFPYELMQYPERMLNVLGKSIKDIRGNAELESIFLTRASDKAEPTGAADEQSGLVRRMWRDIGGLAGAWDKYAETGKLEPERFMKAQEEQYRQIVYVQGEVAATNNALLNDVGRLSIQRVYPKYGPWLESLPDSSPIKKYVFPDAKSKSPDELLVDYEQVRHATGGKVRYNAPDSAGIDYAVKERLGITFWNKWIKKGTAGRAELLETWHSWAEPGAKVGPLKRAFGAWAKRNITEKQMEDMVEWLDHRIPWGKLKVKLGIVPPAMILLLIIYAFTQARSGGKEEQKEGH